MKLATNNSIKKFSLIIFPTLPKSDKSTITKDFFLKACNNIMTFSTDTYFLSLEQPEKGIENIDADLSITNKGAVASEKNIDFYYPSSSLFSVNDAFSSIYLEKNQEFLIRFKCTNLDEEDNMLLLCKKGEKEQVIIADGRSFALVEGGDKENIDLKIKNNQSLKNKSLLIDISKENSNSRVLYKVSVNPALTPTTSLYLTLCYSVLIISISLLISIPSLIQASLNKPNYYKRKYVFVFGLIVSFNFWYFLKINDSFGFPLSISYLLIILLMLLSIKNQVINTKKHLTNEAK